MMAERSRLSSFCVGGGKAIVFICCYFVFTVYFWVGEFLLVEEVSNNEPNIGSM